MGIYGLEELMNYGLGKMAFGIALGAFTLSLYSASASAQGVGGEYGAREPARCVDRTQPTEGPLNEEQLLYHLRCTMEGIGDGRLYLAENMTAEIAGEGRAFDPQNDYFENIDRTAMIYPIRGSLLRYNCHVLDGTNEGESCETFEEDEATGSCYKMTNGDWNCRMSDLSQVRSLAPPPQ
jgi:hypothetical protein